MPGAVISVKNTFLVAEGVDDDEITKLVRAARRRAVKSCPMDLSRVLEAQPAPEILPEAFRGVALTALRAVSATQREQYVYMYIYI